MNVQLITLIIQLSGIKAIICEYMEILQNISNTQFIDSFLWYVQKINIKWMLRKIGDRKIFTRY